MYSLGRHIHVSTQRNLSYHNNQSEATEMLVLHGHDVQGTFNEAFEYFI
jgi:hypothetical protein